MSMRAIDPALTSNTFTTEGKHIVIIGWLSVPAQWTASIWTTIDAAGNGAKCGATFEHTAERALMWFFYSALLGAVVLGLAPLLVVSQLSEPHPARPTATG